MTSSLHRTPLPPKRHLVSSRLVSSRLVSSRLVSSCLVLSCLVLSCWSCSGLDAEEGLTTRTQVMKPVMCSTQDRSTYGTRVMMRQTKSCKTQEQVGRSHEVSMDTPTGRLTSPTSPFTKLRARLEVAPQSHWCTCCMRSTDCERP